MQGLDREPTDFEWKIFPGATALDLLHEIQADLQGNIFRGISLLGRGILKKNNRDTIHFKGEYCNFSSVFTEESQSGVEICPEQILEK